MPEYASCHFLYKVFGWSGATDENGDRCWVEAAQVVLVKLASLSKTSIAAVNGSAAGMGFDLALACKFRYASCRTCQQSAIEMA